MKEGWKKRKSQLLCRCGFSSVLFVLKQNLCLEKFKLLMKLNHIITSIQMSGDHGCTI